MSNRKKLIEVALPLDDINRESAREKSIRHGHPSTLHLWWSRKPLATCRAVLFASLVDDPGEEGAPAELLEEMDRLPAPEPRPDGWESLSVEERRRQKVFRFIGELVRWENSSDERVLDVARSLIRAATNDNPPPALDPFAGGGSIPLEAQRLGLEAHGSDLNPVAVLITKALIEIPPKFAGKPPVNPDSRDRIGSEANYRGAQGLAEDVRHYGKWMRDEAEKRIGHLYPTGPNGETVIAWIYARTVECPNPACGAQMPLASKFWLSKPKGGKKEKAWVEPVVDCQEKTVSFEVHTGDGEPTIDGTVNRRGATCIVCDSAVPFKHIRSEGQAGRMDHQLMAVVAEGQRGRTYLTPTDGHEEIAKSASGGWRSEDEISHWPGRTNVVEYGMAKWGDLFTSRQLVALTTFSDLVGETRERARRDAAEAGLPDDTTPINDGGTGAQAYADAVATYLAFALDKGGNLWSSICGWMGDRGAMRETFARQAIPMTWDFAEANPFSDSGGNFNMFVERVADTVEMTPANANGYGKQHDAVNSVNGTSQAPLISSDPPYYDNIGYADLADFFYVWLRRALGRIYPEYFGTFLTPKGPELVATPYRFGGDKRRAQEFFEEGLGEAFARMREAANPDHPVTIYYAFKQAEANAEGDGTMVVASTGWESMLEGLISTGFQITGTWPMRTESSGRALAQGSNALASSIVLVCRPRAEDAPPATRREFQNALRRELPGDLRVMMGENIAPVDLAQATIGPGMAIYSRYSEVLEADGSPLPVRAALQMINGVLDEILAEQEGELDDDSRFCLAWFTQRAHDTGPFGEADVLARARNTSVAGLERAGVVSSQSGDVRLLRRDELPEGWDPTEDDRVPAWESTQHLVRAVMRSEREAAALVKALGPERAESSRALSYRLYQLCERKSRAEDALAYNTLVQSWPRLQQLAAEQPEGSLF